MVFTLLSLADTFTFLCNSSILGVDLLVLFGEFLLFSSEDSLD